MKTNLQSTPPTAADIADERDRLEVKKAVLIVRRRCVVFAMCWCAAVLVVGPIATVVMGWTFEGDEVIWTALTIAGIWAASMVIADAYDKTIEMVRKKLASLGANERSDWENSQ